ncbi:MAG TPA: DUF4012 domain-containing protein [Acidimicrobiales bacterium]|nr:DUF4012 domain-containing protein [Acidimicrobiales bacterium]
MVLGLVGLTTVAGAVFGAFVVRDLRRVEAQLRAARAAIDQAALRAGGLGTPEGRAAVTADLDAALVAIASARATTVDSPAISATGVVPGLGRQRSGLLQLIDDSSTAATVGRELVGRITAVAEGARVREGGLPLDDLAQLRADVGRAAEAVGRLRRPGSGLWGPLGDARRRFDELAVRNARRLSDGGDALEAARSFMGAAGPRRYLVALENNAEMRDQGAVLSYVVCRFDGGRLSFERNGSVVELALDRPAATPLPPGTQEVFGPIQPTRLWQSVNATADFAWSGQAMHDMYRQATAEAIDGVIAIDVPGLAGLLRAVGPVAIAGVAEPIGDHNVGRILLHDLYQGLGPRSEHDPRRERQGDITEAVIDRLTSGSHDAVAVGRELGEAARRGHLRLWSSVADEERVFEQTGLGGGPATALPDRTFHIAVQNRTATKLDYYVKPSVRQEVQLRPDGAAVVRTAVVVNNRAPVGAPPSYQLGPDGITKKPGDYLAWVLLWAPAGSTQAGGLGESGLVLSQYVVDVAAGERREVVFDTVIPDAVRDGQLRLRFVPQPRLEPVQLQVRLRAAGWSVDGATAWAGPWDATHTFIWRVKR